VSLAFYGISEEGIHDFGKPAQEMTKGKSPKNSDAKGDIPLIT